MSQPVLLRASLTVALIRLTQVVLPPLLIAFILYVVVVTKGVAFDRSYLAMAGLAGILSAMLLRPRHSDLPVLRIDAGAVAVDMLLRWLVTLGLLYFVGRLAGLAGHFPREIVLSWALVAPLWAFAAILALQFLMRRVVTSRANERSAVIIGMNLAGRQLADRLMLHPELCTRVEGF
ncbi:MAG TPA: hypothetical protein VN762_12795, partial [Steroidobacteraceae bacterium]|nr:hypothetical protein [Steroidobacteraceae bacterium]